MPFPPSRSITEFSWGGGLLCLWGHCSPSPPGYEPASECHIWFCTQKQSEWISRCNLQKIALVPLELLFCSYTPANKSSLKKSFPIYFFFFWVVAKILLLLWMLWLWIIIMIFVCYVWASNVNILCELKILDMVKILWLSKPSNNKIKSMLLFCAEWRQSFEWKSARISVKMNVTQ